MGTVYDAIELFSANLFEQVRMLASRRGWASRAYSYLLSPAPLQFHAFTATTVHLPGGMGASFTPRSEPSGNAWVIDVRRTDGRVPPTADGGLTLMKGGGDGWIIRGPAGAVSDAQLSAILDELAA